MLYVFSFIAGLFAANGVPHFVEGITGRKHMTPFGKPSSAIVNVIWGWVNFVVAAVFIHYAHPHTHILRAFALFALGALVVALVLAYTWSQDQKDGKASTK